MDNWNQQKKYSALKSLIQEGAAQWLRRQDLEHLNTHFELLKLNWKISTECNPVQRFQRRQELMSRSTAADDVMGRDLVTAE